MHKALLNALENDTGNQTSLASPSPYTDKKGFAKRWSLSTRTVDSFLSRGMCHLKIGKRRVRICIPEADAFMHEKFHTQRRGAA